MQIFKQREAFLGSTPLHLAAASQRTHTDVVAASLLEAGADLHAKTTSKGSTPLHLAELEGYWEVLTALLNADADLEVMNSNGFTPIHTAALASRGSSADRCKRKARRPSARWMHTAAVACDIQRLGCSSVRR